jgi:hypothetical protein
MRDERKDARPNRTDRPEEASFHHLPGDLEETETAEARENRLSDTTLPRERPTATDRARKAREERLSGEGEGGGAPGGDAHSEPQADGDDGDGPPRPDTWTTKANPLA